MNLYKGLMFPKPNQYGVYPNKWSMEEIDKMDIHFFNALIDMLNNEEEQHQDKEVYLSDIW